MFDLQKGKGSWEGRQQSESICMSKLCSFSRQELFLRLLSKLFLGIMSGTWVVLRINCVEWNKNFCVLLHPWRGRQGAGVPNGPRWHYNYKEKAFSYFGWRHIIQYFTTFKSRSQQEMNNTPGKIIEKNLSEEKLTLRWLLKKFNQGQQ